MQKICSVAGGVKAYVADPRCLLSEENCQCPFCADRHRLRLHGHYYRYGLLPDPEAVQLLPVFRLFCPREKKTVSLLPDFCTPRRQYGPAVLGIFLASLVLLGQTLLEALRQARAGVPGYQVGQALLRGFRARGHQIRAYLAGLRPRAAPVSWANSSRHHELVPLVAGLLAGFADPAVAFVHHGRALHERFGVGLA
jgi:hypothetical protein